MVTKSSCELQLEAVLVGHTEDRVWHVSWSSDGVHLATCGEDKIIRIWTEQGDKWVCTSTLEEGTQTRTIRCCEWSPDNTKIASASFCGVIAIWESQTSLRNVWDQIASLEGHENEVKGVSWNFDGTFLASCGRDKKVWLWEHVGGTEFECVCILEGHTQDVKSIRWSTQRENNLFSASYDDTVRVWTFDGDDWFCVHVLTGHSSTVWGICTGADDALVSCSDDLSIISWSLATKRPVSVLTGVHSQPIYSVDMDHSSSLVVSGAGDNCIGLHALAVDHSLQHMYTKRAAHDGDVNCVRWRTGGRTKLLASCGDDGFVKIWRYIHTSNVLYRDIAQSDNQSMSRIIKSSLEARHLNLPGTAYCDPSTDTLFEVSQRPGSAYFVAEVEGKVVGGCGVTPTSGLPEHTAEVIRLFVDEDFYGQGIGSRLLEMCIEFSKSQGGRALYLETLGPLTEAISLYRKRGFRHLSAPLIGDSGHCACDVWMLLDL